MPEWMHHLDGRHLAALVLLVGLVLAVVAAWSGRRDQPPTADKNRRAHADDTAQLADEAAHQASGGGSC